MTIVRIHVALLIGFVAVLLDPATAAAATSADGFVGQSAKIAIFILGGVAIAAVVAAAIEVTFRTMREGKWSADTAPVLSALTAQRYYTRVLYGLAPAAVASAIALVRGAEVSAVVFLFAVMTITATALRAKERPLHLMPIARVVFNAAVPAAGIAVALIPGAFGEAIIGHQHSRRGAGGGRDHHVHGGLARVALRERPAGLDRRDRQCVVREQTGV